MRTPISLLTSRGSVGLTALLAAATLAPPATAVVQRLNDGQPIVTESLFESAGVAEEGANLSGPSLVRLPEWLPASSRAHPWARYYLYFAAHDGDYIRLAWAERIEGPWRLHAIGSEVPAGSRGVLDLGADDRIPLENAIEIQDHVASPHVQVDDAERRFVMYFHAPMTDPTRPPFTRLQRTFVATSADGLDFNRPEDGGQPGHGIRPVSLGGAYFQVFEYAGTPFAIANRGDVYRARRPRRPWTPPAVFRFSDELWLRVGGNPNPLAADLAEAGLAGRQIRHATARVVGERLDLFYTRIGDAPERILYSSVDLAAAADVWDATFPPLEILAPERPWEGRGDPREPSRQGSAPEHVRQVRDPSLFHDRDGRWYLLYTGRGEDAIGVARLLMPPPLEARVDVLPGRARNRLRLLERRAVRVALFGSPELDVTQLDPASLAFGPDGGVPRRSGRPRDLDGDGAPDVVFHFSFSDTGIALGETQVCLRGELADGTAWEGCDAVEPWVPRQRRRGPSFHRGPATGRLPDG